MNRSVKLSDLSATHRLLYIIGTLLCSVSIPLMYVFPHLSFLFVFLCFCGVCCIIYGILLNADNSTNKIIRIISKTLRITALSLIGIFFITQILIQIKIFSAIETDNVKSDYILVLGGGINGTSPSLVLKSRLDVACDYLSDNPDCKAILCGGLGKGNIVTEAYVMKKYMLEKGISKERLIEEDNSKDTTQNILFAKSILGSELNNSSIGVVTSDFHIYRATFIMKKADYPTYYRIPAKTPDVPFLRLGLHLREYFSIILEYLNL